MDILLTEKRTYEGFDPLLVEKSVEPGVFIMYTGKQEPAHIYETQDALHAYRDTLEHKSPRFTKEIPPYKVFNAKKHQSEIKSGSRYFLTDSWLSMYRRTMRQDKRNYNSFYERIFGPTRMYLDWDCTPSKAVEPIRFKLQDGIALFVRAMRIVVAQLQRDGLNNWDQIDVDDIEVSTSCATTSKKESYHFVLHFCRQRRDTDFMFEDSYHCGYFVARIINTCVRLMREASVRIGVDGKTTYGSDGFADNPLFYKTKDGYECMVDNPYDRGRNWRMLYSRKNKEADALKDHVVEPAFLFPLCEHVDTSCEEAGCVYRTKMTCSREKFFSYCPTFVRVFNGVPNHVTALRVPASMLLKSDGTYVGGAGEDGKHKRVLSKFDTTPLHHMESGRDLEARRRMRDEMRARGYSFDYAADDEADKEDDGERRPVPREKKPRLGSISLFEMIIEQVRDQLAINSLKLGVVHRDLAVLISDDHQYCPHVDRAHSHNHVWFLARLGIYRPRVTYWCKNPSCEARCTRSEDPVPRVALPLSDAFCLEFQQETLRNLENVSVAPDDLRW